MKKLACVLLLMVGLASLLVAASYKVVVEGEKYTSITPSMKKTTGSTLASGGAYIEVPLLRPHAQTEGAPKDQGKTVYAVKIPAKGTYRFYARAHWHDGCGNSFFLKIGTKPAVTIGQDGTYQRWHWVKGPLVELPAGTIQVVIQNREDGAKIDQFMFTTSSVVPVRIERATQ